VLPSVLLLGSGVLGAVSEVGAGGEIAWVPDFASAHRMALQQHRPLLLSFYTPGCLWCAKLNAETFSDPDVVKLSNSFVCVRLDSDFNGALCTRYGVLQHPTTLLLSPAGRVFARVPGYLSPERFVSLLRMAKSKATTEQ
jgi:thioredoxin-related protein